MLLVCLAGLASPLSAQFSVQPVIVTLAPTGQAQTQVVTVVNQGGDPTQFTIYPGDFEQAENGEHTFPAFGEHPRSCRSRLTVSPEAATLQPGEQQQVVIRMEPGAETCWSLVFVERTAQTQRGVWATERIGVKVHGVVPNEAMEGEVTQVQAAAASGGAEVTLRFENRSRVPLRPEGTLEIRTLDGELVHAQQVEAFSVLPDHARILALPVQAQLPAGQYLAVPILDFGGEYLAGGQAAFRIEASGEQP